MNVDILYKCVPYLPLVPILPLCYMGRQIYLCHNPPSSFQDKEKFLVYASLVPKPQTPSFTFPEAPTESYHYLSEIPTAAIADYLHTKKCDFFYLNWDELPSTDSDKYLEGKCKFLSSKWGFWQSPKCTTDELYSKMHRAMMNSIDTHMNVQCYRQWVSYMFTRYIMGKKALFHYRKPRYPVILIETKVGENGSHRLWKWVEKMQCRAHVIVVRKPVAVQAASS